MSWSFSPLSEPYLQRFVAAVPPPDLNNKWFQKFGDKSSSDTISYKENTTINTVNKKNLAISYEDFFDNISSESIIPAEYILQECFKNPILVPKTAVRLSPNAVEQLFVHIFSKHETEVPSKFIITFLVNYIKVQYSQLCIELLVQINERYPAIFRELLEILINDMDVPTTVLSNYISQLNEETCTDFMKILLTTETTEGFTRNMLAVFTVYKDCVKDDAIQNYVQKMIILHGKNCTTDKSFGRLLLTFLQTEKALGRKVCDSIEQCIQEHRSLFKRSCMLLLEDISNK